MINVENIHDFIISSYNEDTEDQLDYYIEEDKCNVGDIAYLYNHADKELTKMEITHIIARSDDMELYDSLDEDILCDRETEYNADTSAEFITDDDCYLVWFKYV